MAGGAIEDDEFFTISITPNGNLLLSGAVDNEDLLTETTLRHSNQDFWLLELSPDGTVIWEKKFEGVSVPVLFFSMQSEEKLFKLATLLRCLELQGWRNGVAILCEHESKQ